MTDSSYLETLQKMAQVNRQLQIDARASQLVSDPFFQQNRTLIKRLTDGVDDNVASALDLLFSEIEQGMSEHESKFASVYASTIEIEQFSALKPILALTGEARTRALLGTINRLQSTSPAQIDEDEALKLLASKLYKDKLPLTAVQLATIILTVAHYFRPHTVFPPSIIIARTEAFLQDRAPDATLENALQNLKQCIQHLMKQHWYGAKTEEEKLVYRIDMLLKRSAQGEAAMPIVPDEAWSDQAIADLNAMDATAQKNWFKLIEHCRHAGGTKPSKTWSKKADEMIDEIGEEVFADHASRWLGLIPQKGTRTRIARQTWAQGHDEALTYHPQNVEILKGLAFCCASKRDSRFAVALGDAAEAAFKKVPNLGPRSPKLGNACVHALSAMNTKDSVAQLTRVQAKAKHSSVRMQIGKALDNAASKSGMTVDDLQDLGVPTFGMQEVGILREDFGQWTAQLIINDAHDVVVSWQSAHGKSQIKPPSGLKTEHAEALKVFKKAEADLQKLLPGVRNRIERSFIEPRHWTFGGWRERFLDHPVTGTIARRLVWTFNGRAGIWHEGKITDLEGLPIEPEDESLVELWHPIGADADVVLHWRRRLSELRITQPFKQCHREICLLTDAERQTSTYSNRFAQHIVKQHQLQSLCAQRGWQFRLMGEFDAFNVPTIELPRWNLAVEFFVVSPEYDNTTRSGIYTAIATDKVQFSRRIERKLDASAQMFRKRAGTKPAFSYEPLALSEIMPIVFSEIMRDVDLFVSVCSIGTDPNWNQGTDPDRNQGYREYWHDFSFGELSAAAHIRKSVLQELLPSLKIHSQCRLEGNFLVVCGQLRTYKIHLGSGSIQMEPNNQYLCIVPAFALTHHQGQLFLPFKGDQMLSVIISKAFMLANDTSIKDPSIMSQIRRTRQ